MDTLVKIMVVAAVGTLGSLTVKRQTPEIALLISVAAGIFILFALADPLAAVMGFVTHIQQQAGLSDAIITPVIKSIGIAIISRIGSEVCREAGSYGLATAIEIGAAVLALIIAMPLISAMLNILDSFV